MNQPTNQIKQGQKKQLVLQQINEIAFAEKLYVSVLNIYKGKYVIAERFIRTLKSANYKYITSVSKTVYIVKLNELVNKYDNTCHSTIKIKPVNGKKHLY